MTEVAACIALATLAAMLLRLSGSRGLTLALACVALVAGCWLFNTMRDQGPGATSASAAKRSPPTSLASDRHAFTGRFTPGERWLTMADAIASRGNTADAANVLVAAVKAHPRDYSLWIGLGNMLTDHGGGQLNPGARLAFERARAIAPDYPAPLYFLGVAEARSGNVAEARRLWSAVLAGAPPKASWRPLVERRLASIAPPTGAPD